MRRNPNLKPNVFYDCEMCGKSVARYMTPFDQRQYPPRFCSRQCSGIAHRGSGHHAWAGGRCIVNGYVEVFAPDHPHATARGYVREHRLVMEQMIGRILDPVEVVHHEDDDTQHNEPRNLRLFPNQAAHKRYEMQRRKRDAFGRLMPRSAQ